MQRVNWTVEEQCAAKMRKLIWQRLEEGDAKYVERLLQVAAGDGIDSRLYVQEQEVVYSAADWVANAARSYAMRNPSWLPTPANIAAHIAHRVRQAKARRAARQAAGV